MNGLMGKPFVRWQFCISKRRLHYTTIPSRIQRGIGGSGLNAIANLYMLLKIGQYGKIFCMETAPQPARIYLNHRDNQRERILAAAELLFIQQGIEKVNLSMIARAARMTRNTIYEYFPSKQEIAWAILGKILTQSKANLCVDQAGTGMQRLENFVVCLTSQLQENPQHMRFLVEINTLYAREVTSERMRQTTGRSRGDDHILRLIEAGIADGSIRPEVEPALTAAAVWNLVSGMNARFALLGDLIQQEYEQPAVRIYHEIIRIFFRGIQTEAVT